MLCSLSVENAIQHLDRCHTCDFVDAQRASESHRIEQRSIPKPKKSRATVRRAMTQRAARPVTLATLKRDTLSRVKVAARLCRRCDIGCDTEIWLTLRVIRPCMHVVFNLMQSIYTNMQA